MKVAGIVLEQHPDRAVLFMQWKKMDWPVLADPFNEMNFKVVPVTLLIDESGVIRYRNPKENDLAEFLETKYPSQKISPPLKSSPTGIAELEKENDGRSAFRLGVAYRQRYDSDQRQPGDFAKAIKSWSAALETNPGQYIWRRRIQQYGPRLDKPYSFYDWVNQARQEIKKRGETPHPLSAEPGGSEFAFPGKSERGEGQAKDHPDPKGLVARDEDGWVRAQVIVVPTTKGDGKAVRVHLKFKPDPERKIHWTNDAGELSFFPEKGESFSIHDFQNSGALPEEIASSEERSIEFEVRPAKGKSLPESIGGSAFYYVCEDTNGTCQFFRQDLKILLR